MPKASVGQTGFSTGEVSPLFYGDTKNPRYAKGLETALNYLPALQGPLIRAPGFKYAGNVKDSTNPPVFIPFKFSAAQNYVLEFGDFYIRFWSNNGTAGSQGAVLTVGTTYQITGTQALGNLLSNGQTNDIRSFYATRTSITPLPGEYISATSSVSAGSILELVSPYSVQDVPLIRWCQNADTVYLFHPNYPTYKLQRRGQNDWKIVVVQFTDGPYLPANSYATTGDNVNVQWDTLDTNIVSAATVHVGAGGISGAITDPGGSGQIQITTSAAHGFTSGQRIFIYGVTGTTEANNRSAAAGRVVATGPAYWVISVTSTTTFLLLGSTFTNAYGSAGNAVAAVFSDSAVDILISGYVLARDEYRLMAFIISGARYWGFLTRFFDAATIGITMDINVFSGTTTVTQWYLGVFFGQFLTTFPGPFTGNGYPALGVFHQNRMVIGGCANAPQEVDGSNIGLFEDFEPSPAAGSAALVPVASNAFSFILASEDQNPIRWMESTAQALLAGTYASEWAMTPSGNSEALSSTNFNAQQSSFYGSANIAAAKIGNAVMYVQRASRKLREMAFFFMAGTFRSTDLTEISEHITLPSLIQIAVQKEPQPLIWGIRSDGALVSLIYDRNDVSLSVGWTRRILGGASDSAGTPPIVLSMAVVPDPLVTFDQMWVIVKRWINGAIVCTVEYMTKTTDDSILAEDSFQADCGGTYDVPKTITAITIASPGVVTSAAHGFSNGDAVQIVGVNGLNKSTTDTNGNVTSTNAVNEQTFVVASVATNTFALHDFSGNNVSTVGYGVWVSGGQVRKLVTTISGVNWLENETVGVLTDGGIHPDVVVSNSGVITLNYPAAKVQFGYRYKSQGKLLRAEAGSADGSSIGATRRTTRAAIQMHRIGDLSIGTTFNNLIPIDFSQVDQNQADNAVPLFSGIVREGLESAYDFESQLCFEESSMLPGIIQSITTFMEEQDV